MEKNFQKNGAAYIQNRISRAISDQSRHATICGNFEIEQTILIPSDFTLILEDCHLVMADNTFCNMFTNENCRTAKGRTLQGTDHNINLIGIGNVILDGGTYNGLSESTSQKDGYPHVVVNNLLLFTNVDGFTIQNLHCRNQRYWALDFVFCRNGRIRDIDFLSDYSMLESDGTRTFGGLSLARYQDVYVKNSDGIDLRSGCHDIMIENITGFTEDDTVALTALNGSLEEMFEVEGLCPDIYNVIIRNVNSAALCSNIRLLNQGGRRLYNVLIDGVMDASYGSPYIERGNTSIRVGEASNLYDTRYATAEETFNITIRNVISRARTAVYLAGAMRNPILDNIQGYDGCKVLVTNQAEIEG